MKICIIAVGASSIIETEKVCRRLNDGPLKGCCEIALHYVGSDFLTDDDWPDIFKSMYQSEFVLLDTMGVPAGFGSALVEAIADYRGHVVVVNATSVSVRSLTRLGRFSLGMMRHMASGSESDSSADGAPDPARMMNMVDWMEKIGRTIPVGPLRDMRNFIWISKHWLSGTQQNITSMLHLIGREYFGYRHLPQPEKPAVVEDCSVMDPASGRTFKTVAQYREAFPPDPDKPGLGLLFRARTYPLDTHPLVARLADRLSEFFSIIPVAVDSTVARDFKKLYDLLAPGGRPLIDALVNPEAFRLSQGPMGGDAARGERFLRDLNVPVLHPFFLTKRTCRQWHADSKGADVPEFLISIFLPELDGAIEMYPFSAVGTPEKQTPVLAPIEDRIDRVAYRAHNWSQLRRMDNGDKRLAILLYNYPPGEESIGSASFLDTFSSLAALLEALAAAGYNTSPMTARELRETFVQQGLSNSPAWSKRQQPPGIHIDAAAYGALTRDLPGAEAIDAAWGPFPGRIMRSGCGVHLPGIINGNIFIGLQPARSMPGSADAAVHDKTLPPHHQYAACYRWIERQFGAHAMLHLGTHGTLEFLPGKEKALSAECFPDALTGALPHIYIYYSGNPSEAMIAKRRTHAVMIGHLPPPFKKSGLYDELRELRQLLDEHAEAAGLSPGRCPAIVDKIRSAVAGLGWPWADIDDVHRRLHDMERALMPARLHTLGSPYSEEEIAGYLAELFRGGSPECSSLHELFARSSGIDWERISTAPHAHEHKWEALEERVRHWITDHIIRGQTPGKDSGFDEKQCREHIRRGEAVAKALSHNGELDAVVRALSGKYIAPGLSGDLFRSPEILPTGRNLVQFDPRQVPSPAALSSGAAIAEATIESYRREHGRCPRSTAVILWGLETAQTHGETVGQILRYLGVRPVPVAGQWDPRLELIPLEELGRPRIDVTIQICGFFRDMFPGTLSLLHDAFTIAGFADEPEDMNSVRANARHLFAELCEQDMQEDEARELALARVFGPPASEYGTGVEEIVKNRSWQSETELAGAYIDSLKHVYTPQAHGRSMEGLLTANLSMVEVVSQVRGSCDYEITDLDHYYEFYGGLARSVEEASGKKAMLLLSDTHGGSARTEDVRDAVFRGVHTRLTNPDWLAGQLSCSHQGGHEIAKRMENLIGLAATTGAVSARSFDHINEKLVLNDDMRRQIQDNNPYAMLEIAKRLFEAHTRGYWDPDDDTLDRLKNIYLELENHLEGLEQ